MSSPRNQDLSDILERESNYGSEFGTDDETAISFLLTQAESQQLSRVTSAPVCESIEGSNARVQIAYDDDTVSTLTPSRVHKLIDKNGVPYQNLAFSGPLRAASVEVEYDMQNRIAFSPRSRLEHASPIPRPDDRLIYVEGEFLAEPEAEEPDPLDRRTPLDRFKKTRPLSVTNIVSPAWCEIQYWYSLTKYGKVRRTKAMEQGSSVHKVMEEQTTTKMPVENVNNLVQKVLKEELKTVVSVEVVAQVVQAVLEKEKRKAVPVDVAAGLVHKVLEKEKIAPVSVGIVSESVHKALGEKMRIAVPVDITTKEDAFGLRIWNIIQGLRTLRATGMTREIEVWAVIAGEVVNGVIDELSYECPDDELEAKITEKKERSQGSKRKRQPSLPHNQRTIMSLWQSHPPEEEDANAWLGTLHEPRKVYLTDIKTRGSSRVPSGEVSLRPTAMQLMMYHRMLSSLASDSVLSEQIFERYHLESDVPLSDTFITQVGSLELNFGGESVEDSSVLFETEQDAIDELLAHNTLGKLWSLMISEFARAIPFSKDSSAPFPVGDVLRAEYRASGSGSIVGTKTFAYDAAALDAYLDGIMAWWRGERMPKGVDIEEAFKCRICEFAERCSWRKEKVDQSLKKANRNKLRRQERGKSEV